MSRPPQINFLLGLLAGASVSLVIGRYLDRQKETEFLSSSSSKSKKKTPQSVPPELREEQLSRHTLYFGKNGMDCIRNSKVCVVGLGGVGSHTAVMLARGGVEKLRLIDFDQVTLSSLNRHACATLLDVGISKVTCVKSCCENLGVKTVDARVEMYTKESGSALLDDTPWDLVIDCIDDVPTKAALLAHCIRNKIRVLSCMGAGGKSDVTRLHISDLRTAAKDPLASKLRQTMKRVMKGESASYLDDMEQLTIIYSSEKTVAKLSDLTDEQKGEKDKSKFGAVDGMRIRVLPVLGPIPAVMGQSLAAIAMCELGKKPIHQPVTGERVGRNVRNKMFQHVMQREKNIEEGKLTVDASYTGKIEIMNDDIDYLLGMWRNRCAVTGARLGTVLSLARWDLSKPATSDNLVLMCTHALKAYDQKGKDTIPEEIQKKIESRLATARNLNCDF
jgi:tRNA A37 threonylcarbamoyladenosine dehydratase